MMKYFLLLFFACALFSACNNKLPEGIVPPATMKNIMWDMMVAEQVHKSDTSKNTRLHLEDSITTGYNEVLSIYKISYKTYKQSMQYYESHPDLLEQLFDSVSAYGKRLNDSLMPQKETIKKKALSDDSLPAMLKSDSGKLKTKLPVKPFLKPLKKKQALPAAKL